MPAVDAGAGAESTPFVPPQTDTEQQIAAIWGDLLGVADFGIDDDFFQLGGHSLLATQIVNRLRKAFGIKLEMRRLFENPTIRDLSACVDAIHAYGPDGIGSDQAEEREIGEL